MPGVSNLFYTVDRGVLWMGSLKQVYSFILLSAHVEVDLSLVSERICAVKAALENSVSFFYFTVWLKLRHSPAYN